MSVGSVGVLVGSPESYARTGFVMILFSCWCIKTLQRCWLVVSEFDNCWDSQALKDDATLSKCYRGGCLHERNARLSWVRAKFISENKRFCWELVVTCWLKILHQLIGRSWLFFSPFCPLRCFCFEITGGAVYFSYNQYSAIYNHRTEYGIGPCPRQKTKAWHQDLWTFYLTVVVVALG